MAAAVDQQNDARDWVLVLSWHVGKQTVCFGKATFRHMSQPLPDAAGPSSRDMESARWSMDHGGRLVLIAMCCLRYECIRYNSIWIWQLQK